ncbi:unnamed protein product, partial [Meganyctiphanes norvegica]
MDSFLLKEIENFDLYKASEQEQKIFVGDRSKTCGPGMFSCGSGACINESLVCDGTPDCLHENDEIACFDSCWEGSFVCGDGRCLLNHHRCDGHIDCPDDTDEIGCGNCVIWKGEEGLPCSDGKCIFKKNWCDGLSQCSDFADEKNCGVGWETAVNSNEKGI